MSLHVELLASDIAQLVFVSGLVMTSVWIGQSLYKRASRIEHEVSQHIENRKRPELTYVLYDIVWAPIILLTVFLIVRGGAELLPAGSAAQTVTTLLDGLIVFTMFWFAVRVIKTVFTVAGRNEESSPGEV